MHRQGERQPTDTARRVRGEIGQQSREKRRIVIDIADQEALDSIRHAPLGAHHIGYLQMEPCVRAPVDEAASRECSEAEGQCGHDERKRRSYCWSYRSSRVQEGHDLCHTSPAREATPDDIPQRSLRLPGLLQFILMEEAGDPEEHWEDGEKHHSDTDRHRHRLEGE